MITLQIVFAGGIDTDRSFNMEKIHVIILASEQLQPIVIMVNSDYFYTIKN